MRLESGDGLHQLGELDAAAADVVDGVYVGKGDAVALHEHRERVAGGAIPAWVHALVEKLPGLRVFELEQSAEPERVVRLEIGYDIVHVVFLPGHACL